MDRSTMATLSTYSSWFQTSHLQGTDSPGNSSLRPHGKLVTAFLRKQKEPILYHVIAEGGIERCTPSMDSSLEAFSCDPMDASITALAFPLTGFTKYPNKVFLSY